MHHPKSNRVLRKYLAGEDSHVYIFGISVFITFLCRNAVSTFLKSCQLTEFTVIKLMIKMGNAL